MYEEIFCAKQLPAVAIRMSRLIRPLPFAIGVNSDSFVSATAGFQNDDSAQFKYGLGIK